MADMPDAQEIEALKKALAQAQSELRLVRTERDLLQEQLNRFKRQLFDAKSEAAGGAHQKDLFFDEAEAEGAQAQPLGEDGQDGEGDQLDVPAHKRARRGRKPLDAALPREVVRHELPEGERVCPHDGAALAEIGVEVSEQLDIIPQQVRVIRHERVKYACPCCDGGLRLAPRPPQVIPKGLLTEAALAWVIGAKYLDGLPLYRQAALLGRFGGAHWSRNTLAAGVVRVGAATQPVINLLRDALLEAPIVHGDETEVQVLKEPGRKAQARSYMWVQMTQASGEDGTGPPIRLFGYRPSRSTEAAKALYEGMRPGAVLMSDGYESYEVVARRHGLVHLGCWAHCRRYFHDALQALPKDKRGPDQLAARFIELIGRLYHVEAQARRDEVETQALLHRRQQHSKPVLDQIRELALQHLHGVLPGSLLGKALHYVTAQWPKLERYVQDGSYPIDNNDCENAIRPFVVGRRNWLFADTQAGANASANLYSLLQTCLVNGIDGYRYLKALLVQLPNAKTAEDFEALLPWRIALT
ncbi:IS66 family transposase [Piscinibacter koreensis]|uniref:IS66 family transposase n=1 Tax=Piscinibacter koreensis TaxID=2742824 RepID=A0A7Y6NST0_9BURK|nr:IS66 family transposase [Schlegelella koreensis]NUZ08671.1 IS66 family transposase [Schlegelella koreensis]